MSPFVLAPCLLITRRVRLTKRVPRDNHTLRPSIHSLSNSALDIRYDPPESLVKPFMQQHALVLRFGKMSLNGWDQLKVEIYIDRFGGGRVCSCYRDYECLGGDLGDQVYGQKEGSGIWDRAVLRMKGVRKG